MSTAGRYSNADLQYLEHGTGPLAAELDRLWQAKGTMKGGTAREDRGGDDNGPHVRPVTERFYPGLQDPPPGHDGRNAGGGR